MATTFIGEGHDGWHGSVIFIWQTYCCIGFKCVLMNYSSLSVMIFEELLIPLFIRISVSVILAVYHYKYILKPSSMNRLPVTLRIMWTLATVNDKITRPWLRDLGIWHRSVLLIFVTSGGTGRISTRGCKLLYCVKKRYTVNYHI